LTETVAIEAPAELLTETSAEEMAASDVTTPPDRSFALEGQKLKLCN
jgi:hypothetical protein